VHCDVGGGYGKDRGRLWWAPFNWILNEAMKAGLTVDAARINQLLANPPERPWAEEINNSFKPAIWHAAELVPKMHYSSRLKYNFPRCNFWRRRQIPQGALIDATALERIRDSTLVYVPSNLPAAFCSSVRSLVQVPASMPVP